MAAVSFTTAPSSCWDVTIDSIQVGKLKAKTDSHLAKKVDALVQSKFFKKQLTTPGEYRLVKKGDSLTLERKEGDKWTKVEMSSSPTELATFKKNLTRLETAAQEPFKTSLDNNSCYLNASYALVSNTSLREKLLDPSKLQGKLKALANPSAITSGKQLRDALDVKDTHQDDAQIPLSMLQGDAKLVSYDIRDADPVAVQKSQEYATQSTHLQLNLGNTKTGEKHVSFRDLHEQFMSTEWHDGSPEGSTAKPTFKLTPKYDSPLLIQIHRQKPANAPMKGPDGKAIPQPLEKDLRAIKEIPIILAKGHDSDDKVILLQGMIVHGGKDNYGHYVAYVRKENLEGKYDWWKVDGAHAEQVKEEEVKKASEQATHLYYDQDPEVEPIEDAVDTVSSAAADGAGILSDMVTVAATKVARGIARVFPWLKPSME